MPDMVKLSIRLPAELAQAARVKAMLKGGVPLEMIVGKLLEDWVGREFVEKLEAIAREVAAQEAAITARDGGERPAWMDPPQPRRRTRSKAAQGTQADGGADA